MAWEVHPQHGQRLAECAGRARPLLGHLSALLVGNTGERQHEKLWVPFWREALIATALRRKCSECGEEGG